MTYRLGIDLGTTFTAAAVCRPSAGERPDVEVLTLGNRGAAIPTVISLAGDGSVLVGEAAERRALTNSNRVAREFKRRIGDDTPMLVGGVPMLPEELAAKVVAWVVERTAEREGGPAEGIVVTHPASWGPHRRQLLADALDQENLADIVFLPEPEAAALGYAGTARVEPGSLIGVYDLGGGTFDATVVRKVSGTEFELLGDPQGIDQLGGVDFDLAVFDHVRAATAELWANLDTSNPAVLSGVAGVRRECTGAKEALSADTETAVPVIVPGSTTQVRLTRAEFEDAIRAAIGDTVTAMGCAISSAGLTPADLSTVLLVGGSSRIPLVAQLLSAEFGIPVSADVDPKTVVAVGAAMAMIEPAPVAAAIERWQGEDTRRDVMPVAPVHALEAPPALVPGRDRRTTITRAVAVIGVACALATVGFAVSAAEGEDPAPTGLSAQGFGTEPGSRIDPWTGTPLRTVDVVDTIVKTAPKPPPVYNTYGTPPPLPQGRDNTDETPPPSEEPGPSCADEETPDPSTTPSETPGESCEEPPCEDDGTPDPSGSPDPSATSSETTTPPVEDPNCDDTEGDATTP